jgi:hypothetical protein
MSMPIWWRAAHPTEYGSGVAAFFDRMFGPENAKKPPIQTREKASSLIFSRRKPFADKDLSQIEQHRGKKKVDARNSRPIVKSDGLTTD